VFIDLVKALVSQKVEIRVRVFHNTEFELMLTLVHVAMLSSCIPTHIYHPPTDTSPLNYKRLRTESAAQSITAAAHEQGTLGESALSSCLGVPLGPEGDVSMDTTDDFGGASGSSELAPITIPTLPAFPPEEAKPTEPGDCHGRGLQHSLAKLDAASHAVRLKQVALEQRDKQTARTYSLAVSSYEKWWGQYQMQLHAEDPQWTTIPAFPITAAKAVMFLEYETSRPKVNTLFILLRCPNTSYCSEREEAMTLSQTQLSGSK
jgi:hypothetical protein